MSGQGENMLIAGIDQDMARTVEWYNSLTPTQRGELAEYITRLESGEPLEIVPHQIQQEIGVMAALGMMSVMLQWSQVYNSNAGD